MVIFNSSKQMKILCVIDSLAQGGSQRQLVELALNFKERGNEVSLLIYHSKLFFSSFLVEADIKINCINEPRYLIRLFKIRWFIRHGKFDSVLSFLEAPNFICEVAGLPYRKWKLVVGERSTDPKITRSFKLRTFRWFHLFADYIVANSYSNLKLVYTACPLLPVSKGIVIYNLIDFNYWKADDNIVSHMNSKFKIVVAARQDYNKNLNGLIDAVALLEDKDRDRLKIEWYGNNLTYPYLDNSFLEALQKMKFYGLENIFTFFPAIHDIVRIIKGADAIGLFSFYEGFPNAIIEGMACRKPVICSSVSDMPKIISYDPKLLFDPLRSESLRDTLHYLINLSNDQLSLIGRQNEKIVRNIFDRNLIISRYLELLEKKLKLLQKVHLILTTKAL